MLSTRTLAFTLLLACMVPVAIAQTADGNGYVGATDLPPGAYRLAITTPEGAEFRTIPEPVTPGRQSRPSAEKRSSAFASKSSSPLVAPSARSANGSRIDESDFPDRCGTYLCYR